VASLHLDGVYGSFSGPSVTKPLADSRFTDTLTIHHSRRQLGRVNATRWNYPAPHLLAVAHGTLFSPFSLVDSYHSLAPEWRLRCYHSSRVFQPDWRRWRASRYRGFTVRKTRVKLHSERSTLSRRLILEIQITSDLSLRARRVLPKLSPVVWLLLLLFFYFFFFVLTHVDHDTSAIDDRFRRCALSITVYADETQHKHEPKILSTVDRVIARISALDCDGRDWASPREAVLSRVAPARPPFYPHHRRADDLAASTSSPALPAGKWALRSFALFPASRVGLSRFHREAARDLSFSLVFPPDARFSNGPHTSRPGHAHTRTGLSPSPPSPPFRKPAILFRTSFRTRWGRPHAPRPADSICQPKVVFFSIEWIRFVTRIIIRLASRTLLAVVARPCEIRTEDAAPSLLGHVGR